MGIYIHGMEMPTACRHGECNFACSAAYQTGLICIVRKQYVVPGDVPGDCPCSLVPPHGRLIDADALIEKVAKMVPWAIADPTANAFLEGLSAAYEAFRAAPTIIPAEPCKEKGE